MLLRQATAAVDKLPTDQSTQSLPKHQRTFCREWTANRGANTFKLAAAAPSLFTFTFSIGHKLLNEGKKLISEHYARAELSAGS